MKKPLLITNIVLTIAILIGDILFMTNGELLPKSLASAGFVLMGIINLIFALKNKTSDKNFAIILTVGLFFAMLGDIILEIEFVIGAALFAVGHIFFFVSYCSLKNFQSKDLIIGSIIFVICLSLILFLPIFDFGGVLMQVVCIVYALIISLMVSKASMNFIREKNPLFLIIMVGSILFMFSDLMLLFNVFAEVPRIFYILCLSTYYPAEILLAYSNTKTRK